MLNLVEVFNNVSLATSETKSAPFLCEHKSCRNPVLVDYEAGEILHYLCPECHEADIYFAQEVNVK